MTHDFTDRVVAIWERVEAASPAPWEVAEEIDGWRAGRRTVVKEASPGGALYGETGKIRRRIVTVDQTRNHVDDKAESNVEFIAHAREDVEWLIGVLDRVTGLFEKWADEENEHTAAGEYGLAQGFRVASDDLLATLHGSPDAG